MTSQILQQDPISPSRDPATPPRYDDLPDLVTPEQARAFLQIGRTAVYALVKSGALRSIKFGATIRIPKTALLGDGKDAAE